MDETKSAPDAMPNKSFEPAHVKIISGGIVGLVAAAVISVMVLPTPQNPTDYGARSQTRLKIYYKRGESAEPLLFNQMLQIGETFRVALSSVKGGTGYLTYFGQQSTPRTTYDDFVRSKLVVNPGAAVEFSETKSVSHSDQGMTVVVLMCAKQGQEVLEGQNQGAVFDEIKASLAAKTTTMKSVDCELLSRRLW